MGEQQAGRIYKKMGRIYKKLGRNERIGLVKC
jgi:hypothetical protein